MSKEIDTLVVNFEKLSKIDKPVDVKNYFIALALDIIASCTYGLRLEMSKKPHNEVIKSARLLFGKNMGFNNMITFLSPKLATFLGTDMVDKIFREYIGEVAGKTIKERQNNPEARRNDLIQIVADAETREHDKLEKLDGVSEKGNKRSKCSTYNIQKIYCFYFNFSVLSRKEMIDNAFVIFLAGFDAPSIVMSAIAYCLALNPEVQDKLIAEIQAFYCNKNEITYENVHELKYLDAVVHETLRLYPPVMRTERRAVADIEFEGLKVPKDTIVILPSYAMHRDPAFWPEPEKFKPERFFSENRHQYHPFAYIPFASGYRNCLGNRFALTELKVVYARLLQKFRFEKCEETKVNKCSLHPIPIKFNVFMF